MEGLSAKNERPSLEERLQTVDGMFVLAAGYPGEMWMADKMETLGIFGALEYMPTLRSIYFVGGKSERSEIPHLSVQNAERFTDKLSRQQKSSEDSISWWRNTCFSEVK